MPEPLTQSEIDSQTDPTVAKQYDDTTPKPEQTQDFYQTVDALKSCMLTTIRPGVGPVSRSMAIAKRHGPDFLFLANIHSKKFEDLKHDQQVQITFQNSSTQDWASITGKVTTATHDDPRVQELYSPAVSAWFGDLKDGKFDGTADDPRMALIEVRPSYIVYWKSTVSSLGFVKEVGVAAFTGKVANTGVLRELLSEDIEAARASA